MKTLHDGLDLEAFFARLAAAGESLLLLDYDGTLAPFHVDPRLALPYPRVCATLRRVLARPGARVAIVSGRRLEDLRAPLALLPHSEAWASHGWEHQRQGRVQRRIPSADARELLSRAAGLARPLTYRGARIEPKLASVALHWRGLGEHDARRVKETVAELWAPLTCDEVALLPFDGGLELRARGRNKGDAVREMLAECPAAVCAYLGDDLTDEDAFRAIRPHGLAVLVRERHRRTVADLWLSAPWELTAFLDRWATGSGAAAPGSPGSPA